MSAKPKAELPTLSFVDQAAWRAWLEAEHATSDGIWLKMAKKTTGIASINYAQALDEALCYGWIDGQKKSFDEQFWLQKFTPRGKKSIWSKVNRDHIERLTAAGLMHAAGEAEVERAKADGRWDAAYDSPKNATVPEDFQAALDASPTAASYFATLKQTYRYSFLFRIQTAKKPETRAKRIGEFIAMLERGETF
ncbi:YdeI/OmpD-associated family protein [Herpetosiphon llansteffanensis]|uniref:YdeI/OmpD-associated family protein n=1 Tax=Herpetosiphon llansteffanensis TaxID=2094568 RepID=UPI000D7CFBFD|nr:YdeI/OmpD-associated family protein [Herpetosiphon llansteffanensis]